MEVKGQLRAVSFLLPSLGSQTSTHVCQDTHCAISLAFVLKAEVVWACEAEEVSKGQIMAHTKSQAN